MLLTRVIPVALLLTASATAAAPPCPMREQGTGPWITREIMSGDSWAWVYLDIDRSGQPLECRLGENNMSQRRRAIVCMSFLKNWKAKPVQIEGSAKRTTIKRYFVMLGDKHEKHREARKRFFLEHPDERPECYPE